MALNNGVFKKLAGLLVFVMMFVCCASNKAVLEDSGVVNHVVVNAENAQEGILLEFDNIPEKATRVFIHFMEIPEQGKHPIPVFADIRGVKLEALRETGRIICPFAKNGHSYYITASIEEGDDPDSAHWIDSELTVAKGIHTVNDIALTLNDTQTSVVLSEEPDFSASVQYGPQKYHFVVTLMPGEFWSLSFGEEVKSDLSWDFLPRMIDDFKKDGLEVSGLIPAYVTAYCTINYQNITWMVGVANSKEFTVSL